MHDCRSGVHFASKFRFSLALPFLSPPHIAQEFLRSSNFSSYRSDRATSVRPLHVSIDRTHGCLNYTTPDVPRLFGTSRPSSFTFQLVLLRAQRVHSGIFSRVSSQLLHKSFQIVVLPLHSSIWNYNHSFMKRYNGTEN